MKVFFVSLRTSLIYGPTELTEVNSPEQGIAEITCPWLSDYRFDEWEGYAVVVPEKEQVWGAAKPVLESGVLKARFQFTPMPIPRGERRLFHDLLRKSVQTVQQLPSSCIDED